ncbi:uncharacterized protein LOC127001745 [Eriocheir sinensis]|uniref:uncharacterized protein LOC127001745 n=1 Tax=Eriocheir sinensis TaxID=95602 RepID=UPI0021C65FB2|nr:uncharacterized protein LOC127001745 [Eriocheir sinensis]
MALLPSSIPVLLVVLVLHFTLPVSAFFQSGIKLGINLGANNQPPAKHPLHYCTAKQEQLLRNLYVDYFQSTGPCVTPDGTKLYPFKSSDGGGGLAGPSVCVKLPNLCQLLGKSRGRSILEVGKTMMANLQRNMRSLYQMLTGRPSPMTGDSTHSDSRVLQVSAHYDAPAPIVNHHVHCDYGGCEGGGGGGGVPVCETVEDLVFPMIGVSALTNATVTVIQAFPDLVQPVFFRRCRSRQAQVVYGECVQEYLPVSLLVAPPYPGAVLAHDFVLVESGCRVAAHVGHHYGETQPREAQQLQEGVGARESDRRLF